MTDLDYLFQHMEKRFGSMEDRLTLLERRFDELQEAVAACAKRADSRFQEMVALSNKRERHDSWLH
jgi:uncharacterized coiled-coil protein SlyX